MTVTLFDKSGESPIPLGAATVPVGGDLSEGMIKLKVKGTNGRAGLERVGSGSEAVQEAEKKWMWNEDVQVGDKEREAKLRL
jgi:hypothetical protein